MIFCNGISLQVRVVDGQTSIAPVLMRYQRGCQQVGAKDGSLSWKTYIPKARAFENIEVRIVRVFP